MAIVFNDKTPNTKTAKKPAFRGSKVAFIAFKKQELINTEQVEVTQAIEIERRVQKLAIDGFDYVKAVYEGGGVFDFTLPMTDDEIERKAAKLFRNL